MDQPSIADSAARTGLEGADKMGNSTFFVTLALILLGYYYYMSIYTHFPRLGLKGPLPWPLIGNLFQMIFLDRMETAREWTRRYGKVYGVFMGTRPSIMISDPEVLRQVCIKDFDAMPNHDAPVGFNDYQRNFLFFAQDDHWKRLRALQSPTFTSGKIKRMYKLLDRCADDLLANFNEQAEAAAAAGLDKNVVHLKETYSLFTMDAITTAAYTIKLDRKSKGARADFVSLANKLFEINIPRIILALVLPAWLQQLLGYKIVPMKNFTDLDDRLRPIAMARKSGRKSDDYLQILVDARLDDQIELNDTDDKENHHAGITRTSLQADQAKMLKDIGEAGGEANGKANGEASSQSARTMKLSDFEIVASAIFLLVVGQETTATLLTNCTYALAFNLDIQQRLYETVKAMARRDPTTGEFTFDYEELTANEYLDAVISETLRCLSPVIQLDRLVGRDYVIEKYNLAVKKGDKMMLAYYAIMNDPDYWPEPLRFDPERFMGDNKKNIVPGSYCPFGLGPRHCLGMRFSLTESKLGLAKVMMRHKFQPAPGTSFPPRCGMHLGLNNIKSPFVEVLPR